MTKTPRPLAKALHTVTSTARVASMAPPAGTPAWRALWALDVLGYSADQIDQTGPLFAACVKAVQS